PQILWAAALAMLSLGRLETGWRLFEARFAANPNMPYPFPEDRRWRGQDISGQRLLVWCEQGIGDEILFGSCITDLAPFGAKIMIACDRRLTPLYERSFPGVQILGLGPGVKLESL